MPVAGISPMNCPPGTKFHVLNLGTLQADEGFLVRGGNTSSLSQTNPANKRRDLMAIAVLIDHPHAGLLLFETGCAEDIDTVSDNSPKKPRRKILMEASNGESQ